MANTQRLRPLRTRRYNVGADIHADTPLLVGNVPCVALTDSDADGNATCGVDGAWRFDMAVYGDHPAGTPVYLNEVLSVDASDGNYFGVLLEPVTNGASSALVDIGLGNTPASTATDTAYLIATGTVPTDDDTEAPLDIQIHPDYLNQVPEWFDAENRQIRGQGLFVATGWALGDSNFDDTETPAQVRAVVEVEFPIEDQEFAFRLKSELNASGPGSLGGDERRIVGQDPGNTYPILSVLDSSNPITGTLGADAYTPYVPGAQVNVVDDGDGGVFAQLNLNGLTSGATYTVDWGDGTDPDVFTYEEVDFGAATHFYAEDGTYSVHITGNTEDDLRDTTVPGVVIDGATEGEFLVESTGDDLIPNGQVEACMTIALTRIAPPAPANPFD